MSRPVFLQIDPNQVVNQHLQVPSRLFQEAIGLPLLTDKGRVPSACWQARGQVGCYTGMNRRIRGTGLGLQPRKAEFSCSWLLSHRAGL